MIRPWDFGVGLPLSRSQLPASRFADTRLLQVDSAVVGKAVAEAACSSVVGAYSSVALVGKG